jgi:hypothetical protein
MLYRTWFTVIETSSTAGSRVVNVEIHVNPLAMAFFLDVVARTAMKRASRFEQASR